MRRVHFPFYLLTGAPSSARSTLTLARTRTRTLTGASSSARSSTPRVFPRRRASTSTGCSWRTPRSAWVASREGRLSQHLTLTPTLPHTPILHLTLTLSLSLTRPADVKKLSWFDGLDWKAQYDKTLPAPHVPTIKSATDDSNFDEFEEERHGQSAPLAVPRLGFCASSGRARRLWAARHSQEEAGPLGAQPLPRVLELTASKVAHFAAFDHTGRGHPAVHQGQLQEERPQLRRVLRQLGREGLSSLSELGRPHPSSLHWVGPSRGRDLGESRQQPVEGSKRGMSDESTV